MRGRWLRRGRLPGLGGPCLRKRQRRNHCASKNNSCSSHVFSFVELPFPGCFGARVPFGCLDQPYSRTLDSDTEESALSGHAPRSIHESAVAAGVSPANFKQRSRYDCLHTMCYRCRSAFWASVPGFIDHSPRGAREVSAPELTRQILESIPI